MKPSLIIFLIFYSIFIDGCSGKKQDNDPMEPAIVKPAGTLIPDSGDRSIPTIKPDSLHKNISTNGRDIDSLIDFAQSLTGTPYKYASTDPNEGFDCSGFITHVFNHFGISVPRSSKDFEFVGTEIPLLDSRRGDLILFTGTDSTERIIGHMGIIVANDSSHIKFIHSSSGKAMGVVTTELNKYYEGRYVKTIRVF